MFRFPQTEEQVVNARNSMGWSPKVMTAQWNQLQGLRKASEGDMKAMLTMVNAGLSPAEAYREMDSRSSIILNPIGEFSTLQKSMAVSRSVDLGRQVLDYRQASAQTKGETSMSGQTGIKGDKVTYNYAGTPIPIHDKGVIVDWREGLAMTADGFDYMVDNMREAELSVMRTAEDYLWDGDSSITVKDRVWAGLRNDTSVLQSTTALDFLAAGTTAVQMVDEFDRLKNLLRITNNCPGEIEIGVSREVLSRIERTPYSVNEKPFGSVKEYVTSLTGIKGFYEDPRLTGGQQFLFTFFDQVSGFHAVTGMALSTYMKQRLQHNDNWEWMKWMAMGFLSRNSFSGQKCVMYVQAA